MGVIGNLMVHIGADSKGLEKGLSSASQSVSKFSKGVVSVGKTAVKATAIASAAFAGAAIAIGSKSLAAFADFEKGMNEVFTLLPGISGEAMSKMESQVKDFSREFGVLTEDAVPALYQALSAGVPPDNVFEFLETAQKAAKGGVASLETAVNGITTVVNSYGAEVVNATEASDMMFTTVKLGKTTFEELSNSLFNVLPTASSLGVAFEDVSGAMATMTTQGTPTSVATTQLRQLFVELSKASGNTAITFKKLSGKSFADFIKSGGNVAGALEIMEKGAVQNGVSIADMFGSVEAGAAALQLTGDKVELFAKNVAEMEKSAGATDKAFEVMNKGITATMDRLKANIQVTMIEIGDALAPAAEDIAGGFLDILSGKEGGAERMAKGADELIKTFVGGLVKALPKIINTGLSIVRSLITGIIKNQREIVRSFGMLIGGAMSLISENLGDVVMLGFNLVSSLVNAVLENAPMMIDAGIDAIKKLIRGIKDKLPDMLTTAVEVLTYFASAIVDALPELSKSAGEMLTKIRDDLKKQETLKKLVDGAVAVVTGLADFIADNLGLLLDIGLEIITQVVSAILKEENLKKLNEAAYGIADSLGKWIAEQDWAKIGKDIALGIVNGFIQNFSLGKAGFVPQLIENAINGKTTTTPYQPKQNAFSPFKGSTAGTGSGSAFDPFATRSFAVGTNYVPYDMTAQIHKGEAIIPAEYNKPQMFGQKSITVNVNGSTDPNMVAGIVVQKLRMAGVV